jgi:hypothetical protein
MRPMRAHLVLPFFTAIALLCVTGGVFVDRLVDSAELRRIPRQVVIRAEMIDLFRIESRRAL